MLRQFNRAVAGSDTELRDERADLRVGEVKTEVETEGVSAEVLLTRALEAESIVMRRQRPVLAIRQGVTSLEFVDEADSKIWKQRLLDAAPLLDKAIRAVGRIDLKGARLEWAGTGWLVHENILVTNRHVAAEFAIRKGAGFTFRIGGAGSIDASIDFLQELERPDTLLFKVVRPLHIEDAPGPDVAFFEVERTSGSSTLADPIDLAVRPTVTENVATIGYPAFDSRIPEPALMEHIYGRQYDKKRLAPGGITRVEQTRVLHNCTTLGGNSGSVLFDLDRGEAVGLHFSGSFLATNYAVRSDIVKKLLDDVKAGRKRGRATTPRGPAVGITPAAPERPRASGLRSSSLTIPLTVTVTVGFGSEPLAAVNRTVTLPKSPDDTLAEADDSEVIAEDYRDRVGYSPSFLGDRFEVTLPSIVRDSDDVLTVETDGGTETELRYQHFSVVMSRSRRMCFFSAVNIDGNHSRKSKRVGWKWDPRLPRAQQIMAECYGAPPRFSRGHMTRREDPAWGDDKSARRGNEDSMHVTNATPQMQAFNSPIWLALEDYALEHAREDDMKISVFTGPYFSDSDTPMYGVLIPRAFWKIIAFIHDETGELCATGYEMSQERNLQPEQEFVFGAFTSRHLSRATQVPIRAIEARSGLRFGDLASVDALASHQEGIGADDWRALDTLEQIRFLP